MVLSWYIGREGFRCLINHPLIKDLPGIMETPRKDTVDDLTNIEVIRSLMKQAHRLSSVVKPQSHLATHSEIILLSFFF
jgi:hypothetical protein